MKEFKIRIKLEVHHKVEGLVYYILQQMIRSLKSCMLATWRGFCRAMQSHIVVTHLRNTCLANTQCHYYTNINSKLS